MHNVSGRHCSVVMGADTTEALEPPHCSHNAAMVHRPQDGTNRPHKLRAVYGASQPTASWPCTVDVCYWELRQVTLLLEDSKISASS